MRTGYIVAIALAISGPALLQEATAQSNPAPVNAQLRQQTPPRRR
jgi:hypothetical protein